MTMPIQRIAHPRRYPPRITEFTQRFWDALTQGRFLVTRCARCDRSSFPPKPICPICWATDINWSEVDTTGQVYSWTRVHAGPAIFDPDLPYAIGIVDLDVGIRLACPLVGEGTAWRCGMAVELITYIYDDGPFYAATPIEASLICHS